MNGLRLVAVAALVLLIAVRCETAVSDEKSTLLPRTPDVMYLPTPPDVVDAMLDLAEIQPSDVVCDLGCGDGRILIRAAERFECTAIGCDIDPLRVAAARKAVRDRQLESRVRIEQSDLFQVDLSEVTVVTLYLSSAYNRRLIPQLQRLPTGSRVVSHDFDIHGWIPHKKIHVHSPHDNRTHVVYLWSIPRRRG